MLGPVVQVWDWPSLGLYDWRGRQACVRPDVATRPNARATRRRRQCFDVCFGLLQVRLTGRSLVGGTGDVRSNRQPGGGHRADHALVGKRARIVRFAESRSTVEEPSRRRSWERAPDQSRSMTYSRPSGGSWFDPTFNTSANTSPHSSQAPAGIFAVSHLLSALVRISTPDRHPPARAAQRPPVRRRHLASPTARTASSNWSCADSTSLVRVASTARPDLPLIGHEAGRISD